MIEGELYWFGGSGGPAGYYVDVHTCQQVNNFIAYTGYKGYRRCIEPSRTYDHEKLVQYFYGIQESTNTEAVKALNKCIEMLLRHLGETLDDYSKRGKMSIQNTGVDAPPIEAESEEE